MWGELTSSTARTMKITQHILLASLFLACKSFHVREETPPGCVRIGPSQWEDERPLTNLDYWEYLGWTMNHYGRFSPEFKSAFPDTSGHGHLIADALSERDTVPQHKTYFVPKERFDENLCCVSNSQLLQYACWRTEIVHWNRLRNYGLIAQKHLYTPQVFSTEIAKHAHKLPDIFVYEIPESVRRTSPARIDQALKMSCRKQSVKSYLQDDRSK